MLVKNWMSKDVITVNINAPIIEADIIRNYNGRLVSILSSNDNVQEGYRNVYIEACQIDREKVSKLKNKLREKAIMLYFVDKRHNKREIYE